MSPLSCWDWYAHLSQIQWSCLVKALIDKQTDLIFSTAMGLCLSVCHKSSSTKTAKQRIKQTTPHDSPETLVFWCQRSPRNSTRRQMQVGWVKIGDFRQIADYISKTVKDRHTHFLLKSNRKKPVIKFWTPCNISATANARDFRFCTRVGHVKS